MATAGARVAEGLPGFGDELPAVAVVAQRELEHAVGAVVLRFGVRHRGGEASQPGASRTGDDFADAVARIRAAGRILWRKTLVVVVGAGGGGLRARRIQRLP